MASGMTELPYPPRPGQAEGAVGPSTNFVVCDLARRDDGLWRLLKGSETSLHGRTGAGGSETTRGGREGGTGQGGVDRPRSVVSDTSQEACAIRGTGVPGACTGRDMGVTTRESERNGSRKTKFRRGSLYRRDRWDGLHPRRQSGDRAPGASDTRTLLVLE